MEQVPESLVIDLVDVVEFPDVVFGKPFSRGLDYSEFDEVKVSPLISPMQWNFQM